MEIGRIIAMCPSIITHVRLCVYSLSSSCSILFSISEVLFWRRRSFVFVWHFDNCEAQSAWTLTLQILHLSPWRVCPAWKVSVFPTLYIFRKNRKFRKINSSSIVSNGFQYMDCIKVGGKQMFWNSVCIIIKGCCHVSYSIHCALLGHEA